MILSFIKRQIELFKTQYYKVLVVLLAFLCFQFLLVQFSYRSLEQHPSYSNNNFNVFGLNIPRDLQFCGEKIPVNDYAIKENMEDEFFNNKYWKSSAGFLFNKAQKWFPYIEPILIKEGVPDDFKYVAVIESHLSNATSPMGAAGFWQLVPGTARNYGLVVNDNVDERMDVEKSTRAACKLLKDAYKVFNNWTLAAASYNLGIAGIQNALAKQGSGNYYDLLLNRETGSFIYRILAYKTLLSNPEHFGIKRKSFKYFPKIPVKSIKVDSSITNLNHFAKTIHTNVTIIKLFNPWLLQDHLLNPDKETFIIKIPKNDKNDYSSYYNDLIGDESPEMDSVRVLAPTDSLSSLQIITHIVNEKQTLKEIAEFYTVSENDLKLWNDINETTSVKAGKKLIIKIEKGAKRGN